MKNITQSIKTIALALALSLGISYVSAWTAPTSQPPTGNTAAPINVGSTAQVKSGSFTAAGITTTGDISLPANGTILGGGSNGNYGAINVQGSTNTWSGIRFKDTNGSNSGTLMMHPSYSGFYNAADNAWRWYADDSGTTYQPGGQNIGGRINNTGGGYYSSQSSDWALLGYGSGYSANASPQSWEGSAYVNDIYLRSVGKWGSQIAASAGGASSLTTNGYSVMPSGLIMQWGVITSGCTGTVSFPTAFPSAVLSIVGTLNYPDGVFTVTDYSNSQPSYTTSWFKYWIGDTAGHCQARLPAHWIALGV